MRPARSRLMPRVCATARHFASTLSVVLQLGQSSAHVVLPTGSIFFFFLMIRRPPRSTLFPTRRSSDLPLQRGAEQKIHRLRHRLPCVDGFIHQKRQPAASAAVHQTLVFPRRYTCLWPHRHHAGVCISLGPQVGCQQRSEVGARRPEPYHRKRSCAVWELVDELPSQRQDVVMGQVFFPEPTRHSRALESQIGRAS